MVGGGALRDVSGDDQEFFDVRAGAQSLVEAGFYVEVDEFELLESRHVFDGLEYLEGVAVALAFFESQFFQFVQFCEYSVAESLREIRALAHI